MIPSFSIAFLSIIPAYFALKFEKVSDSPTETKGFWTFSYFGETNIFRYYVLIMLLFEIVIPITILTVFNLLSVHRFKKIMREKIRRQKDNKKNKTAEKAEKANIRFTKLIIALTFICIVIRSIDSCSSVFYRLILFYKINLTEDQSAVMYLVKHSVLALMFGAHALDCLLYYIYDKQIKALFKRKSVATSERADRCRIFC